MNKRKRRQDFVNIQRRLIKELRENHINMQIPYYPDLKLTNGQLAEKLGVNEQTYCRMFYGSNWNAIVLNPSDAYSWRCFA